MTRGEARISVSSFSTEPIAAEIGSNEKVYNGKGWWVTPVKAFIIVLVAILLALIVGLLVHWLDPSKECPEVDGSATTSAPTTTAPPPVIDYRLPDLLKPNHYILKLRPDIYTGDPSTFTFNGSVDINVTCTKDTDKVILHSRSLNINSFKVFDGAVSDSELALGEHEYDSVTEFLTVPLSGATLKKGNHYMIKITFDGKILPDLRGIYYSSYEYNNKTRYLLTSQLQSTDARKVFPCFDEPQYKATFDITLERKDGFNSMSNGVINKTTTLVGGWTQEEFSRTPIMSTYILAFIVSDFDCVDSHTVSGTLVQICARPNAMDQMELANNVSAPIQTFFEEYHNVSYPLEKTIHAGVPDFAAGAMENWGLIIYRDYNILYNPLSSTDVQKQRIVVVIAHELAHMWFGNLVSMDWWNDVWLNEGFASYMETLGTASQYPEWNMEDDMILDKVQDVMVADSLATSHPVFMPADTPAQISAIFDSITYDKGASIIRMMRYFLGEDIFRWGLSNYLKDRAYSSATHTQLFDFLEQEALNWGKDIKVDEIMQTWIQQLGYPVVKFSYDRNTRKLSVSQKIFLVDPNSVKNLPESPYNYVWQVPISFVTNTDTNTDNETHYQYWLKGASEELVEIPSSPKWILGNVKERFYYRVNYDQDNWDALADTLRDAHTTIDRQNRAQLIDDSFNLGRSGELNQTQFFEITKYLKDETEHIPWWSATRAFKFLDRILGTTADYGLLLNYMQKLIEPQYIRIGWDETGSPHVERLQRSILLQYACHFGLPACVDHAVQQYKDWMDNSDTNNIPPNLRFAVYCTAIAEGDRDEWNFAFDKFKEAGDDSGAEERNLLQAMACTRRDWLLRRYLDMAWEETYIRRQDFMTVFNNVADSGVGAPIAWGFMVSNWDEIYARFGSSISFYRLVKAPAAWFTTEYQYSLVQSFVDSRDDLGSGAQPLQQSLETIRSNIDWRERNQPDVSRWLEQNQPPPSPTPPVIDYRLPALLKPNHYTLKLRPDIYTGDPSTFTFNGSVDIDVTCTQDTDKVILHSRSLNIQSFKVLEDAVSGSELALGEHKYDSITEFLTVPLSGATLKKGNHYIIKVTFDGKILPDLRGIYYSSYEYGDETRYLLTSQLQSTDARKVFPCFDEPQYKATFDITLERKDGFNSMSNGVINKTTELDDGWTQEEFSRTPIMSTYILAFIVSRFDCVNSTTDSGKLVQICARPNAMDQMELANNVSAPIQTFFEEYHNVSYPLEKTIHAGVPDFAAGAMENWGLIIYRDYNILYNPISSTDVQKQRIVVVIAHELAHMWFGNLVSMDWWNDVWLNEGFASYMETLGTASQYPEWNMEDDMILDKVQDVMVADSLATSHPVFMPADTPAQISAIFDSITYDKGASIIRMMRYFLGEDIFRWGLSNYLKDRAYSSATHTQLFDFLEQYRKSHCGDMTFVSSSYLHNGNHILEAHKWGKDIKVDGIMQTWIQQLGYPVVKFSYDQNTRKLSVSQKIFLVDPNSAKNLPESPYNYVWQVPISFVTDTDTNTDNETHYQYWLKGESEEVAEISSSPKWILGNVKERFYYRVNYDQDNWDALADTLRDEHTTIDRQNRAQLIDDSFNLGRSGELNQTQFFEITKYLAEETEHIPWWSATRAFKFLDRILGTTADYGLLLKYMQKLIEPQYDRIGWDETGSPHVQRLHRSILLQYACRFGLPNCVEHAVQQYKDWMNNPNTNTIPPSLRFPVYCTAIAEGDQDQWNFAFDKLKQAGDDSGAEEKNLLQAMACTRRDWLLRRYLDIAWEETYIRRQDFMTVFNNIADSGVGAPIAWGFMVSNWDEIYARFGSSISFYRMVKAPAEWFATEYQYSLVQSFVDSRDDLGSGAQPLQQSLETIRSNIDWRERNQPDVRRWLEQNQKPTTPVIDYRLPDLLKPNHYTLKLRPDIYTGDPSTFTFNGSVDINVTCTRDTDKVILHSRSLNIQSFKVFDDVVSDSELAIGEHAYDSITEFLTVPLSGATLKKGNHYIIKVTFDGKILPDLRGIYYSSYEYGDETRYLLTSQLQSTDARKVFPCFDEPQYKATFDITLERKDGFNSMSNGIINKTTTLEDGEWIQEEFSQTPIMSTYILAFIVSRFDCVNSTTDSGKLVQICARPNAMDQMELANNVSAPIQTFFEEYHNVSYPLEKTIHAGVPDFAAGAMENWGLIIYRDYNILYNPLSSTDVQKQRIVVVIAHELAHMWFGNLVSMDWWNDVWLNEGFASYMETLGTASQYPEWNMEDDMILDKVQDVMVADSLATSHPVFMPADTPAQISAIFDSITYDKGASIIRMMRYFLGEDIFRWGLSNYLKDRAYSSATHTQLFEFLEQEARNWGKNIQVDEIMQTWIQQLGYPVVKFSYDRNTQKLSVSQKIFLVDPNSAKNLPKSPYNYVWQVPISFVTNTDTNTDNETHYQYWLKRPSVEIADIDHGVEWILGNVKERFYYRVNYDQDNWDALANTLENEHATIDRQNRAQLIDDSFNLGRSGELDQTQFLEITKYLEKETEHIPWWSATRAFKFLDRILGTTADYGLLLNYMQTLFEPQYIRIGWDETDSPHVQRLQRSILLQYACHFGLPACVDHAVHQYKDWMDNSVNNSSTNTIPPNLRFPVYCTAIAEGDQDEWNFAFGKLKEAGDDSGAEEKNLLQAMACTRRDWLLRRYLDIAWEETYIRRQDFMTVFNSIADSSVGAPIAWEFMVSNWDEIYARFGSSISFYRLVKAPAEWFATEYQYNLVQSFVDSRDDLGSGAQPLQQSLETIRSNIDWRERNQPDVRRWLEQNQSS